VEAFPECQKPSDVSYPQSASADLVKRIRKLRWIGMDEEADQLQILLSSMPPEHRVLVEPPDTD
jgi:hypothetical protein